ncbi:MAG: cupin domain-containing protein [Pseudonocardia sp.]|uniref:cupin domain-containing protein n=1 Tax=unclassified Pseudonocardia TaxID=2619320 RepID=UPI000AAEF24B|nr:MULTISPECIES: cupin domain-containing protein [unclassified Pseudonocardia]MBN9113597.1 cupin domain-containing protein [Pseudonocardia sp.]
MPENIPLSGREVAVAASVRRYRRVVTGLDAEGRSTVLSDGPSPHVQVVADSPTFAMTDFWRHEKVPVDNTGAPDDGLDGHARISPPAEGSVLRIVEFPPDIHWDTDDGDRRERMFHSTASLDYAIVLRGSIWSVMDADERELGEGDVLVQRGTRHRWSNRSDEPCQVAFVLIGGSAV